MKDSWSIKKKQLIKKHVEPRRSQCWSSRAEFVISEHGKKSTNGEENPSKVQLIMIKSIHVIKSSHLVHVMAPQPAEQTL